MNPISIVPTNQGVYIIHELDMYEVIDKLVFGMMKNNEITGLLPIEYMQSDEKRIIKYNISGMTTIEKYIETILSRQKILDLFRQLIEMSLQTEEYLIEEKLLMLGMNTVFIEPTTGRLGVVCLPIDEVDCGMDIKGLFQAIMQKTHFNPNEDSSYINQVSQTINSSKFKMEDFQKQIAQLISDSVQRTVSDRYSSANQGAIDEMAVSIEEIGSAKESNINVQIPPKTEPENSQKQQEVIKLEKKKKKKKGIFQKKEEKSSEEQYSSDFVIPGMEIPNSENITSSSKVKPIGGMQNGFEKTPDYMRDLGQNISGENQAVWMQDNKNSEGTMVSDHTIYLKQEGSGAVFATLQRCRDNEIKAVEGNEFLIGKDAAKVDYAIFNNETISRVHAKITKQGNEYYITDANSMNHTYVDGVIVPPGAPFKLSKMSKIRLSDEEFIFQKP